ncbi:MAG: thioredoxin domain-containing protein [Alphaproteobacteria bacterium]|nr:thioredoxin domain-containing protein [Alphaproteobacteria bacterium]
MNLLGSAASPYLRQHKDNPVHWMLWGEAAFARARSENKPVLLSIGYAACHWCHVMAHESFEDPATADLMNADFVNIKVDREELPDVDALYQNALAMMGQQGGWPLTIFLTPAGEAFWGGTYFPPHARHGLPAFREVLRGVADSFAHEPDKILHNCRSIARALEAIYKPDTGALPLPAQSTQIGDALLQYYDPLYGGMGGAEGPKFPCLPAIALLWACHIRSDLDKYKAAVVHSLTSMCQGGIYDHIGGGFYRYTVDGAWEIPHFEKMLTDNALFIAVLSEVYRDTQNPLFAARLAQTIDWLLREMAVTEDNLTAFASSLDADSLDTASGSKEEGAFYIWRAGDVMGVLGNDAENFCAAYDVTRFGNWPGRPGFSIPNRLHQTAWQGDEEEKRLGALCRKLRFERARREPPARDNKVVCSANALLIEALCKAAFVFDRDDWRAAAVSAYQYLKKFLHQKDGTWLRSRCDGLAGSAARLDDYAHLCAAAVALYEVTQEDVYLQDATTTAKTAIEIFGAQDGGFYMSPPEEVFLPQRPRHADDNALPSGNAVFVRALTRLGNLTGAAVWHETAHKTASVFAGGALQNLFPRAALIESALDLAQPLSIVITGDAASRTPFMDVLRGLSLPAATVLCIDDASGLPAEHPAYGKKTDAPAAAWICSGTRCLAPVTSPQTFREMLRAERRSTQRPPANDE